MLTSELIKQKAKEGRRTGVGITAEGDMLAALGLRYGSNDALKFTVEVHKTLAVSAYRASVEMAKERGAFKVYDAMEPLFGEKVVPAAETMVLRFRLRKFPSGVSA